MKYIAIKLIIFYQKVLSRETGVIAAFFGRSKKTCIFYPTCSEYTKEAIEKYGFFKGVLLGSLRIFRCHPGNEPKIDPVP